MYYADLTDYDYLPTEPTTSRMLNVGWLDSSHPFPVGDVDPAVRDGLVDLAAAPQHVARGMHHCELCDVESPVVVCRSDDLRRRAKLGFAEIHVRVDGLVLAAPTLVVHYIDTHRYLPPQAFLDAVRLTALDDRRDGAEG